jgi:hypothetical protein
MPSSRHDGKPWKADDVARSKKGGSALGFVAGLLQVRGDWAFYKEVFEFPGWQSKQCCWRCCANNAPGEAGDFRICSTEADWRLRKKFERFERFDIEEKNKAEKIQEEKGQRGG